jgi:hypothetical protein
MYKLLQDDRYSMQTSFPAKCSIVFNMPTLGAQLYDFVATYIEQVKLLVQF